MALPTLSVVMSSYNYARYLPDSLQAILDQSYSPLEIIIIDDASTDNSVEVIEEFARRDSRIRLIHNERNMGVIYNSNRLFELASGEYVYGAAVDDKILSGFFEKSLGLLERHPQAALCSTMSEVMDGDGQDQGLLLPLRTISTDECYVPPGRALELFRTQGSWIQGNTCVYRRLAVLEEGGFLPELNAFCDGFLQMVLALKKGACFIPGPLAVWRRTAGNYSTTAVSHLEISLAMWSHAAYLMRTRYADLFPAEYVQSWEEERLCHARLSAIARHRREQIVAMSGLVGRKNMVDRLFFMGMKASSGAQLTALGFYLLLRVRGTPRRVLGQWVRQYLHRAKMFVRPKGPPQGECPGGRDDRSNHPRS